MLDSGATSFDFIGESHNALMAATWRQLGANTGFWPGGAKSGAN